MALLRTIPGKIVLLWDGAPIHRARIVKEFLSREEVKERLTVVALPPYAPDMNPTELANSAIKRKGLGNYAAENLGQLFERADSALHELFATPE